MTWLLYISQGLIFRAFSASSQCCDLLPFMGCCISQCSQEQASFTQKINFQCLACIERLAYLPPSSTYDFLYMDIFPFSPIILDSVCLHTIHFSTYLLCSLYVSPFSVITA